MCWGDGTGGQLGDGSTDTRAKPEAVPWLTNVKELAANSSEVCALDAGGRALCWGAATYPGGLGGSTPCKCPSPARVEALDRLHGLTMGVALSSNGDAQPFTIAGVYVSGQPSGTCVITANPSKPVALHDVIEAAGGPLFACGRTKERIVRCTGQNEWGQLGDGTRNGRFDAKDVTGVSAADQLAVGARHACARVGGAVLCWGDDTRGAVGARSPVRIPAPVAF
jgi:serine/threonine-protein kinase